MNSHRNTDTIMTGLMDSYNLEVRAIEPMSLGVGGDTYLVTAAQGKYVY